MADRILVTGGSGFLGGAIAKHLAARSDVVVAQGRDDLAHVLDDARDVIAVVHAGFHVDFSPMVGAVEDDPHANLASFERVLSFAATRSSRLVFLSAAGVLGVSTLPRARNEDDVGTTDDGFDAYRDTRYIQEKLACEERLVASSVPWTILYPSTVYGRGMDPSTLRSAASERSVRVVPPGGTSWVALADFIDALDRVLARDGQCERFVLNGGNVRYADLVRAGARAHGRKARVVHLPNRTRDVLPVLPDGAVTSAILDSAFGFKYYSSQRAHRTLGWTPAAQLDATIRDAIG
jgi:nucleoside-diphosphate-sugar epimerase